tara:strand:- start:150 stop:365 length:216 start_codon:yes stop_codon:yes gene_type:complete
MSGDVLVEVCPKREQLTAAGVENADGTDVERLCASSPKFPVDQRNYVNWHVRMAATQVIDIFPWAVGGEND